MDRRDQRGFLLIDTLIAGLIITASIAATMYLFRVGFENLVRANDANVLSSKIPTAIHLARMADADLGEGKEDMGDGVVATWNVQVAAKHVGVTEADGGGATIPLETILYKVTVTLSYKGAKNDYEVYTLRFKRGGAGGRA